MVGPLISSHWQFDRKSAVLVTYALAVCIGLDGAGRRPSDSRSPVYRTAGRGCSGLSRTRSAAEMLEVC